MQLSVEDLIASIGRSVSAAQQTIENHSMQRFFDFFEPEINESAADSNEGGTISLKPRMIKISLPQSDDLSKYCQVDIPLPALAHHRQVHLDKVTVRVKTKLRPDADGNMRADIGSPIRKDDMTNDNSQNGDEYGEINLTFNIGESSEGIARVVQNITKII